MQLLRNHPTVSFLRRNTTPNLRHLPIFVLLKEVSDTSERQTDATSQSSRIPIPPDLMLVVAIRLQIPR